MNHSKYSAKSALVRIVLCSFWLTFLTSVQQERELWKHTFVALMTTHCHVGKYIGSFQSTDASIFRTCKSGSCGVHIGEGSL